MALDKADLESIAAMVSAALAPEKLAPILQPILEAHGAAVLAKVPKGVDQKTLDEALAKIKPAADLDPKPKGDKAGDSPEIVAMRAELAATNARLEATEKARQETAQNAARERARNEVKAALGKAGVPANALGDALAVVEATGALVLDGDKPGWKMPNKFNPSLEEVQPFEAGAAAWASTPGGKRFQSPVDVRGTGDGSNPRNGNGPVITSLADLRNSLGPDTFSNISQ